MSRHVLVASVVALAGAIIPAAASAQIVDALKRRKKPDAEACHRHRMKDVHLVHRHSRRNRETHDVTVLLEPRPDVADPGAEKRRESDSEENSRKGKEGIDEKKIHDAIAPSTEVTGDGADGDPDRGLDRELIWPARSIGRS